MRCSLCTHFCATDKDLNKRGQCRRRDPRSSSRGLPGARWECGRESSSLCTATHKSRPKDYTSPSPTSSKQTHSGECYLHVRTAEEWQEWATGLGWMAGVKFGC